MPKLVILTENEKNYHLFLTQIMFNYDEVSKFQTIDCFVKFSMVVLLRLCVDLLIQVTNFCVPFSDGSSFRMWKLATYLFCVPVVVAATYINLGPNAEHGHRPAFVPYEYLRVRTKVSNFKLFKKTNYVPEHLYLN